MRKRGSTATYKKQSVPRALEHTILPFTANITCKRMRFSTREVRFALSWSKREHGAALSALGGLVGSRKKTAFVARCADAAPPSRHVYRWRRIWRTPTHPRIAAETRAVTDLTDVGMRLACDGRRHPKTPAQTTSTSHSLTTERREAEASDPSTHPGTQLEDVTETLGNPGESFWVDVREAKRTLPSCSGLLQM